MNISILVLFITFFIYDIYTNLLDGVATNHIIHEVILCAVAMIILTSMIISSFRTNRLLKKLQLELVETKQSNQLWKKKSHDAAVNFSRMIEQQFEEWNLSPSEKEISFLLIKGLSMKEIAHLRETQEKTVRIQATTIYKKSGLSGRQELAAFFLEDILTLNPA